MMTFSLSTTRPSVSKALERTRLRTGTFPQSKRLGNARCCRRVLRYPVVIGKGFGIANKTKTRAKPP